MKTYFFLLSTVLWTFTACENPFADNTVKGDNRTIHGVVKAVGAPNAANIYVWLDVLNIGVFTDETGAFTLTLPPPSALNSTGNVTGDFDLYLYTINYRLVTKKVIIRDGSFLYNNGDVDSKGRLKNVSLVKAFDAETRASIRLPSIPGYQYGLSVTAHLASTFNGFEINIPNGSMVLLGGIFIIDLDTNQIYKHQLASGKNNDFIARLTPREQIWSFHPSMGDEIAVRKDYRVVPYIFPYYPDLPDGLLASLGISEYEINEKYVSLFFNGKFGTFRRPEER